MKPTPQGFLDVSLTNCFWSDWVSEEAPSSVTYWTFIAGVQCRGPYCDDKRFFYCDPVVLRHQVDEFRAHVLREQEQATARFQTALQRTPYFCPGCPHNQSTRVPAGSCA